MKQCKPRIIIFCFAILFFSKLFAQAPMIPQTKVAVLCPLYLDSAFSDYTYQLGNNNMPQYILTGLDFYNGVMLAVDSLTKEHINAEVWVYDTKKKNTDIQGILQGMKFLNFSLIVASFSSPAEQKVVSEFSFANNIPVISVTYPNDAGLVANPYFILLNSTLKTHVDGVYQFVQQNYSTAKPLFITKRGTLENKIVADFKANDTIIKNHFPYKVLALNNDVLFTDIRPYLDSNRRNIIVCGTLNGNFATSLINALGENPQYKTTVIGMPNWDGIRKLYNQDYDNIEIVYSTPFNYTATDTAVETLTAEYRDKFFARPSDLVYKGFEAMYHYTHLITDYKNEFIGHLSDSSYRWSNHFYIQPVKLNVQSQLPDYLENKNLYFIKKMKGEIISVVRLKNE